MRAPEILRILVPALLAIVLAPAAWAVDEDTVAAATPPPPRGDLHLRAHRVRVIINNGFATTEIEQQLVNPAAHDVAAEWSFPLPEEGSLSELALQIGEEMVVGEVVEKSKARQIFEDEKTAGNDAALMEQRGLYDYRIALARVPAQGQVGVRVVYYQPLEIESGVGRYVYPLEEGGTDDLNRAFWTLSKEVDGNFSIDVILKTAFPVDGLHCPSHPGFSARQAGTDAWQGSWSVPAGRLDRDFVLNWRLRPDVPARVELLTHRRAGDAEGTFMAVVTPGADLEPLRTGTDWIFVLDVSGSMQGEKIRTLKRGVERAFAGLGAEDRVRLIAFNQSAWELTKGWIPAEAAGALGAAVQQLQAGGSTNVFAALDLAYRGLDSDRPCAVILVSDGVANTGPHHYRDFIGLARQHDVRLFTFVMGNSANVRLLGDLATVSNGFAKSVSMRDEIGAHLLLARDRMSHEAMYGVDFRLAGAVARHPQTLPSLYLGQQLVVLGRYVETGPSTLSVSARVGGEERTWSLPVELLAVDERNPELERLYALAAIADLEREAWRRTGDEAEAEGAILDLALRYSLVTDYTSMVVVEAERKSLHGLGDDNSKRRQVEREAAARRARGGNAVVTATGHQPLGGGRAAHVPSREGGGGGAGALGPFHLIPIGLLGLLALRRRKQKVP